MPLVGGDKLYLFCLFCIFCITPAIITPYQIKLNDNHPRCHSCCQHYDILVMPFFNLLVGYLQSRDRRYIMESFFLEVNENIETHVAKEKKTDQKTKPQQAVC